MRQVPSKPVGIGVFEDSIELESPVLEPGEGIYALRDSGHRNKRDFRALILENDFVRATVLPDLGGRIWRLEDRALGVDVFTGGDAVGLRPCPYRGIAAAGGMLPEWDGHLPDFASGTVLDMPRLPLEEGDPAGIELYGFDSMRRLAVQTTLQVSERASLTVRYRIQNRNHQPAKFSMQMPEYAIPVRPKAIAANVVLAPRQTLDLEFEIAAAPVAVPGPSAWRQGDVTASVDSGRLRLRPLVPILESVVRVLIGGEWFDARADLYPERVTELPLPSTPEAIEVRDRHGMVRFNSTVSLQVLRMSEMATIPAEIDPQSLLADPALRAFGWLHLGREAVRQGDRSSALDYFDSALAFDAEDALTWHHKALLNRLSGNLTDESPELPNAHFLSPLEPALRAEAYLSMPREAAADAVVEPLSHSPATMLEVACELRDLGLEDEFARWAEACLRVLDMPMMRYLLADALLSGAKLDIEAAAQISEASKLGTVPPVSRHPIAERAIERLAERFPADPALAIWRSWLRGTREQP